MLRSILISKAGRVLVASCLLLSFSASLSAQYNTNFGKNKIAYRDFDWKIYHSTHFDVYYYEDEAASLEKVVSLAESAYDRLSRRLDYQIEDPIPLLFYATHSAFEQNNIILNFIPEGVGAFASPVRFRMVLPIDMSDDELFDLIMHELAHIFQYHVLFRSSLGKSLTSSPPTWMMEGMASYLADDEQSWDRIYLIDAVVNDRIPPVTRSNIQGFFAYRFGHAVFDFIEERWGEDGLLELIYEFRNTLGSRVDRAIQRTFRMDPEDFDTEFRRWLRKKYLPELIATGEPSDFGRPFHGRPGPNSQRISPVVSPSGDLVASFITREGEIDIALFDVRRRRPMRNLTKGFTNDFQYFSSQFLTTGRRFGNDLAFSPDGNSIAAFARREDGRALVLVDVINGGVREIIDMVDQGVEQQVGPTFSPDGKKVAFSAWRNGQFDIFTYDFASGQVENFTNDEAFDASPVYSPDGKSIIYSTVFEDKAALFRSDISDPGTRYRLTDGTSNDRDSTFSPDGNRLYFTSDRAGTDNIFSLELATGELTQHTNVVTGCFMPGVLVDQEDKERLVYTGFWKAELELYLADLDEPVAEVEAIEIADTPVEATTVPSFEPDIQVAIDDANTEPYGGWKMILEGGDSFFGINDDQTLVGRVVLSFSDYLGDKRIIADLSSVESFSNFNLIYADLSDRVQKQIRIFDQQFFFVGLDLIDGGTRRVDSAYRETGVVGSLVYPFSFHTRGEVGIGYIFRNSDIQSSIRDPLTGDPVPILTQREDDYPLIVASLTGDSTVFAQHGPIGGHRWRMSADWAPDLDDSGTLTSTFTVDGRKYIPVGRRANFAFRAWGAYSTGSFRQQFYLGGLDTLRGFDFRELIGDRAFFINSEFRFPIIDFLATPVFAIQGIRGVIFLDVGATWFEQNDDFDFYSDGQLQDGRSSYGFGITARLFGLDLNWDLAKRWNFDETLADTSTSFWIGTRF